MALGRGEQPRHFVVISGRSSVYVKKKRNSATVLFIAGAWMPC